MTGQRVWRLGGGRSVALDRPRLVAVMNVTPDSFSDGGEVESAEAAAARARALESAGADALDIGGESTRPGAERVDGAEQIRRVVPAIRAIRDAGVSLPISVDTTLAAVAEAGLAAGCDGVNDVSGGEESGFDVARLAAERGAGLVLMHRVRPPDEDVYSDAYTVEPSFGPGDDTEPPVVGFVRRALADRAARAMELGVRGSALVLDPGLGFGKSVPQNLALMRYAGSIESGALEAGAAGVLWGASRKSFVGRVTGVEDPSLRGAGSAAMACAVVGGGGLLFRVHDVRLHREALDAAWAVIGPDAARSGEAERKAGGSGHGVASTGG